jgi:hypothetical protein
MPFTTRGIKLFLDAYFRNGTEPTNFYVALVTSATAPTAATKTLSQLTQITAGNGYTSGGYQLSRNSTDFDALTEDDTDFITELGLKNVAWTASGGDIPASGNPARYCVLTDDNATVASRQIIWYAGLGSNRTALSGNPLTIIGMDIRIKGGSMLKSDIQRGTIAIANATSSNTATITAIDMTKTVVHYTSHNAGNVTNAQDFTARLVLTNSTTLTATRTGTNGELTIVYQIEEKF